MDMRSTLFASALCCAVASTAMPAHASGIYLLTSAGISHFNLNVDRDDLDANTGVTIASSDLDKLDGAYKLQIGYQIFENFAVEGGYFDLGSADYKANTSTGAFTASYAAKGWNLDALLTLPVNAGFSLFFKGGLVRAEVEGASSDGVVSASSTRNNVRPNIGFGLNYNFFKGLSVRAELERFSNMSTDDGNGFDVKADVDMLSFGLSYLFSF